MMSEPTEVEETDSASASPCTEEANGQGKTLSFAWRMLLGTIRGAFPRARQLKTRTLNEWLDDKNKKRTVVLLDVREQEEHIVSTIEDSVHVNPDVSDMNEVLQRISKLKEAFPDASIDVVCFCSVGYRSAKLAESLQCMETTDFKDINNVNIYNLEGSIFKWANEKRKMVDNNRRRTVFCHPYSTVWGKFLNSDLRKWTP